MNNLQGNESNRGKSRLNSSLEAATILSIRTCVTGNGSCVDCNAPSKCDYFDLTPYKMNEWVKFLAFFSLQIKNSFSTFTCSFLKIKKYGLNYFNVIMKYVIALPTCKTYLKILTIFYSLSLFWIIIECIVHNNKNSLNIQFFIFWQVFILKSMHFKWLKINNILLCIYCRSWLG